jgi:hypothetical protein
MSILSVKEWEIHLGGRNAYRRTQRALVAMRTLVRRSDWRSAAHLAVAYEGQERASTSHGHWVALLIDAVGASAAVAAVPSIDHALRQLAPVDDNDLGLRFDWAEVDCAMDRIPHSASEWAAYFDECVGNACVNHLLWCALNGATVPDEVLVRELDGELNCARSLEEPPPAFASDDDEPVLFASDDIADDLELVDAPDATEPSRSLQDLTCPAQVVLQDLVDEYSTWVVALSMRQPGGLVDAFLTAE